MPAPTSLLATLAVALAFLCACTEPPIAGFWPFVSAWACAALWALCATLHVRRPGAPGWRHFVASTLAGGLVLAASVAAVIGLVQYFWGSNGHAPWQPSALMGQAAGPLRQRNQQATLLALGLWALAWGVLQARTWAAAMPPRRLGVVLGVGLWLPALLAVASAATASRTGLMQWLLVVALAWGWWRPGPPVWGRGVRWGLLASLGIYLLAAWAVPWLLQHWREVQADGLFGRLTHETRSCTSRRVLWANVLALIAQRPWAGWGWGELDYAHYITPFAGERFCVLLDNAHNLPLHLAVELGLPVALLACGAVAWGLWRARPWRESAPERQLAWGVLAVIGLHSLLEFPLWYAPFQIVTLLALALLLPRGKNFKLFWPLRYGFMGFVATVFIATWGLAVWDYRAVAQLYKAPHMRNAALHARADQVRLFRDQRDFARLTTLPLHAGNAAEVQALAERMLHFSPEPRVIEKLLDSARLQGDAATLARHSARYAAAYPEAFAEWQAQQPQRVPQPAPPAAAPLNAPAAKTP